MSKETKEEKPRDVQFEERRQKLLARERRVHAKRGSKPDASQRVSCELPDHR